MPISFSAFSLETVVLIERREYGTAAGYVAGSAVGSIGVIKSDIAADNGVIHVINRVLLP